LVPRWTSTSARCTPPSEQRPGRHLIEQMGHTNNAARQARSRRLERWTPSPRVSSLVRSHDRRFDAATAPLRANRCSVRGRHPTQLPSCADGRCALLAARRDRRGALFDTPPSAGPTEPDESAGDASEPDGSRPEPREPDVPEPAVARLDAGARSDEPWPDCFRPEESRPVDARPDEPLPSGSTAARPPAPLTPDPVPTPARTPALAPVIEPALPVRARPASV
jgi:hypothetical protein